MHRPVGEQLQDGGADVAALTATAPAAATAAWTAEAEAAARVEAESAAAGAEAAEPGSEAGPNGPSPVGAVLADVVAEIATGLPAVFVEGAAVARIEAEAERRLVLV